MLLEREREMEEIKEIIKSVRMLSKEKREEIELVGTCLVLIEESKGRTTDKAVTV